MLHKLLIYKRSKSVLGILMALIIMCLWILPMNAYAQEDVQKQKLSELSVEKLDEKTGSECIKILESHGLCLPEVYKNDKKLAENSIKVIIKDLNNGTLSSGVIPYNYTELVELANQVIELAETYDAKYALKNSTVVGSWKDSYEKYNCYGYAIGQTSRFVNPGYYSGNNFSMGLSISAMADLVIKDLDKLGYYAVKTTTKPSAVASWEKVICIRKGNADYHFMKGSSPTYWLHKPGQTNLLKWNYTSPGTAIWTNEYSYKNVSYASTTTYNSTIYYIKYWVKGTGPDISSII